MTKQPRKPSDSLDRDALLAAYRKVYLSRRLDDKEIALKKAGKVFFQINGCGHEAVQVAAGLCLKPAHDWFILYYRDRALCLSLGMTPEEMLLAAVGSPDDPTSAGHQMPSHWGHRKLNIISKSSCTGMQMLHAAGAAQAGFVIRALRLSLAAADDEVVFVSIGDGATSEGEFWEAMNTISNLALPVVVLVEDNGYAISVPREVQTAGGNVANLVRSFPKVQVFECDGTDFFASYDTVTEAVQRCRERKGASLVHAKVIRPYSHSMSDDQRKYRTPEEIAAEARRDPVKRLAASLRRRKLATKEDLEALHRSVDAEVNEAADRALAAPRHSRETVGRFVYADEGNPSSEAFASEPRQPEEGEKKCAMGQLINRCLHEELKRDPRIVVFGQDVADASRKGALSRVKGKGGVFGITYGLQRSFGSDRVFNSPLAEANIIGRAVGMAVRGLRPVVEIQFLDYIWPAYMQIRNELATTRYRSGGTFSSPVVVRVPVGGYLRGGAMYHSQCGEILFAHVPGLRVAFPSTAVDASGLLRTAIRCEDPVIFMEHKHLYRQGYNMGFDPGQDYTIPFGRAAVRRTGSDATIVTYGATVHRSIEAAGKIDPDGGRIEVIDLRTVAPIDWETIERSVKKTSRLLIVYEDTRFCGFGAEIAAEAADRLFDDLDAPIRRVAAKDCFVAYAPELEEAILPQADDIEVALRELLEY